MRTGVLVLGAIVALATASAAEVNCKQVLKYLATGRSVQDVAETMVISESDVKACQEKAAAEGTAGGGQAGEAGKAAGEAK